MTNMTSKPKTSKSKSGTTNALPPKPYTEYTIFFRIERTYLLQSTTGIIDDEVLETLDPNHQDPLEFPRPARYQNIAMPPYWYSSSHKKAVEKKRKHRKREGRMDLKTLSKTISATWRNADKSIVEYCKRLAQAELNKYNKIVNAVVVNNEACRAVNSIHHNGAQDLEDFIIQSAKPQVQGADSVPVITPSPSVSSPTNSMLDNFNKVVMGYGQNDNAAFLNMQQFQQLQAAIGMGNNNLSNDVHSNLPLTANDCLLHSTARGDNIMSGVDISLKKRKVIRRASDPPQSTNIKPYMGLNSCDMINPMSMNGPISCGSIESNANVFLGEDDCIPPRPEKKMRHRISMPTHQDQSLEQMLSSSMASSMPGQGQQCQELISSFEEQLPHGSFSCVPEWKKEDADTLLDMLIEPADDLLLTTWDW